jgi:hypothetical protein
MDHRNYLTLIRSPRLTSTTRDVLLQRAAPSSFEYVPQLFSREDFSTLGALLARLIPQKKDAEFVDLAAVLDTRKATGAGQGWRYAWLPPDAIAITLGLGLLQVTARRLHGADFTYLDEAQKDDLLRQVQDGRLAWAELDGQRWFENLLAEATEIYVSQPATLAAMGFSGIAFLPHWPQIGLNTAQAWEPVAG